MRRAKLREVFVCVDAQLRGMSRLADTLEATPILPARRSIQDSLRAARATTARVAVIVPATRPELIYTATRAGADRVAIYFNTDCQPSEARTILLRAAFAGADLCLLGAKTDELRAAELGADPLRVAVSDAKALDRLFSEPPRGANRAVVAEAMVSAGLDVADRFGLIGLGQRLSPSRGVNVVNYHRVLPTEEARRYGRPQMVLPAPLFQLQLKFFARRGFVPVSELHEPDAKDRIAITFDDGYEDNFRVAFPLLRELSVPACIYLVTDMIDAQQLLWWDEVGLALYAFWRSSAPGPLPDELPALRLREAASEQTAQEIISFTLERMNHFTEQERAVSVAATRALVQKLVEEYGVPPQTTRQMMSWTEVEQMSEAGIDFAPHTASHVPLDELTPERAREELYSAQDALAARLPRAPSRTTALPRGRMGPISEEELKERFDAVMTTHAGVVKPEPKLFVSRRDGRMLTLRGRHHPGKLKLELTGWTDQARSFYYGLTSRLRGRS